MQDFAIASNRNEASRSRLERDRHIRWNGDGWDAGDEAVGCERGRRASNSGNIGRTVDNAGVFVDELSGGEEP